MDKKRVDWSSPAVRAVSLAVKAGKVRNQTVYVGGIKGYLYYGKERTIFPIHTEDTDLWSVNYGHAGASKSLVRDTNCGARRNACRKTSSSSHRCQPAVSRGVNWKVLTRL